MGHLRWLAALVALASILGPALAQGETARQILDRRKQLDATSRKWTDRHQKLAIGVEDRGGKLSRELDLYERKQPNDEQQSILFFLLPADVKGMGFLGYTHKGRPADQWLFLPELAATRRISGRARNEKFVGTDLTFHDLDLLNEMPSWTEDDASSGLRAPETVEGTPCHVVEFTPRRDDIGYKKIVLWLGTEDLVPRQLEFWDTETEPTKRIQQADIRIVGGIPLAHRVRVDAPKAGSVTTIVVSEAQFNLGLEEELFTQRALERGRR